MNEEKNTKLTLELYGNKIQWESPDVYVSMYDLLYAFYGLCVSATWAPETVIESMYEFASERMALTSKTCDKNSPFDVKSQNSCFTENYEYSKSTCTCDKLTPEQLSYTKG